MAWRSFLRFLGTFQIGEEVMAEREGFEPPMELPPCLIASQVHSATLPPLRGAERALARVVSVTNVIAGVTCTLWKSPASNLHPPLARLPLNHKVLCPRMVGHDCRSALLRLQQIRRGE